MTSSLNYEQWKKLHRQILESFPGKNIMVFYSGGKDSSVALHLIQKAGREFGFSFQAHAGIYPKHVFTPADREKLDDYWKSRDIPIQWHEVSEADERLGEALKEGVSPCLICNTAKKRDLMGYLMGKGVDMSSLVIVMSYSLWDLVSASVEHFLGSVASADSSPAVRHKPAEERYFETFQRFYPLLRLKDGLSVFKPLIRYNDQEIRKMLADEGIPVLATKCTYREYRPKRHFASYYERMNLSFDFERLFEFARVALGLPDESFFAEMGEERYLKKVI